MPVRHGVWTGALLVLVACTDSAPTMGEQQVAAGNALPETEPLNVNRPEPPAEPVGNEDVGQANPPAPRPAHPCQYQGDRPLPALALRAVGTEPFWAARIEGRCVTYSTPEDQQGTRVWTSFAGSSESGSWTGFLGKERFVLTTRPEPGCSDGMSDRRYPLAVELSVGSDRRTGCAEPL